MLTQKRKQLLARVLSATGPFPASENALGFRAANEGQLDDLNELEREGVLIRKDNRYSLSLRALIELRSQNTEADRIYHLCNHLLDVVRSLYKTRPGQMIRIDELAKAAEFPEPQIRRALDYLSQASALWHGLLLTASSSVIPAVVQPSEDVLRHRTLDDVIRELTATRTRAHVSVGLREKQQKFGVLDSPTLLESDLRKQCGILGRAVLYLDLDNFKDINTRLTEVVVDQLILPSTHEVLADCVKGVGSAYAEGGDEFTILLPNSSETMALAFAKAVRAQITALQFTGSATPTRLSVSVGVAHGLQGEDGQVLRQRANQAKNHAKTNGKDCVSIWAHAGCRLA